MKKFKVLWIKRYHTSGEETIEAPSAEAAIKIIEEKIGDLEGSLQYNPDEDEIEAHEVKL